VYLSQNPYMIKANYLYGTKSSAIDLILYEQIDIYWQRYEENRLQFSSFGYNLIRNCQIRPEKWSVDGVEVMKCISRVYARQEERSTIFTLKFLSVDGNTCSNYR
jgi:hypothetical protein